MAGHDNGLTSGEKEEGMPLNALEYQDEVPLIKWEDLTPEKKKEEFINYIKTKNIKQRKFGAIQQDADSFGEIKFDGFGLTTNKTAPYIRLDEHTDVEIIWELLVDIWRIPKPEIVISVIGGHENDVFEGLCEAAVKAGAWIVTQGTSSGVTRLVGHAIREFQEARGHKVVALGITNWNVLLNNEVLKNSPSNNGFWPAKYAESELHPDKFRFKFIPTILDCNHTHFICVDNGRPMFGSDIALRTKLLQYIAKYGGTENTTEENTDVNVPVVLVVIDGGYLTIKHVYYALGQNTTDNSATDDAAAAGIRVVILKGSGKAADIIAEAYLRSKNTQSSLDNIVSDLETKVRDMLAIIKDEKRRNARVEEYLEYLKEIIAPRNKSLITIIQMDDSNSGDIARAVMEAATETFYNFEQQLKLAIALDWLDYAEDLIKMADRRKELEKLDKAEFLDGILLPLLIKDSKADFVELFLTKILKKNNCFTYAVLHKLYKKVVIEDAVVPNIKNNPSQIIKEKLGSKKPGNVLQEIGSLLRKLTQDEYSALYKEFVEKQGKDEVSDPDKHLFLWAVMLNRRKLAILFLKRLRTCNIGAALIASRILRALSVYAMRRNKLTLHSDLLEHAREFDDLAIGVLQSFYEDNRQKCERALVHPLPAWGNTTCLSIAYSINNMKFMGHDCCQSKLQSVWNGNLSISSRKQWIAFFFGTIIPIVPVMMLPNDDPRESSGSDDGNKDASRKPGKIKRFFISMRNYYTAPITKFVYNFVSYIILLLLFACFLLTDLRPMGEANSPGAIEWIVVVWVTTMVVDEVRQLIVRVPESMKYKVISWSSEVWNLLDLAMYVLFAVSFLLRLILPPSEFVAARVMYCLTYIIFSLRPLQFSFVLKEVGPKTIMIFKMMKDLAYFLFILILFIVGFGVAVEAILYPNMDPHFNLIARALYKPFWHLYGELFLEEIEGRIDNETCYEDPRFMNVCPQFREYQWVVYGLTAIYLLISNILLINLLIAMFSFTFEKVQENAELIWKFHRYALIFEYVDRPTLAPPLIIIEHVLRLFKFLKMRVLSTNEEESNHFGLLSMNEEESDQPQHCLIKEDDKFDQDETRHIQNYFSKKDQQQLNSTEARVKSIDERVIRAVHRVGDIKACMSKVDNEVGDIKYEVDNMKRDIAKILSIMNNKK